MTTDAAADLAALAQLNASLEALRGDVLATPVTLARALDHTYRVRPHLRLIGDALADVAAGRVERLAIFTPPQVGKSVTVSEWGVFWWLARHPRHAVILTSYAASLAHRRGRRVRRLVEAYGAPYGLVLDRGSKAVDNWQLTAGGGLRSAGMDGGITGNPGDAIWIDDPHKSRAEANSRTLRDRVHNSYSADLLTRRAPGAPIILVMTRWHPDDLGARILADEGREDEGGRWRVIHLPALADPALTGGADPLGRKAGEPLTHPKIPTRDSSAALRHWLDAQATTRPGDWGALYQGNPQPSEGALVTYELLRQRRDYHPTARPARRAVAVDPAGGGRDTVGIIAGYLASDRRLYWTHDASGVMSAAEWPRRVCEVAADTDADLIIVEINYGGDMAIRLIRTAWDALRREHPTGRYAELPPRIEAVRGKAGKLLRADPVAQALTEDHIRIAAPLPLLEEEWATWQPLDPDSPGRIDASVYLALRLLPIPGASSVVSTAAGLSKTAAGTGRGLAGIPLRR
ncbi:hypothetical protein D5H75_40165 [Bailinhaonella thermotolerans]|uniref:Uncharacterized protein n=2 Tax=Bailinhaonella thermotolerans TaxID=1070861 RepID=A0A3A4ALA7_9ACTN|nr:hypothetical protein D5H75_40165 [Bailinhaonella thermotolerans]